MIELDRTYVIERPVYLHSDLVITGDADKYLHNAGSDHMLIIPPGTTNVEIYGFSMSGTHTSGYTNGQKALVEMQGISGVHCSGIYIHHMNFVDFPGFAIHYGFPGGTDVVIEHNTMFNGGNGMINVNAAGRQKWNDGEACEGIEAASDDVEVAYNTGSNIYSIWLSAGGDSSGAALTGNSWHHNSVDGVLDVPAFGLLGTGLVLADGLDAADIYNNTFLNYEGQGLTQALTPGNTISDVNVHDNVWNSSGASIGMRLLDLAGISNLQVDGNTVAGSHTYGMVVDTPNATITNNILNGSGVTADVILQATAAGVTFAETGDPDENFYDTIIDNR